MIVIILSQLFQCRILCKYMLDIHYRLRTTLTAIHEVLEIEKCALWVMWLAVAMMSLT